MEEVRDSKFSLVYKEVNGISAIWFEYSNRDWIVDPCVLFNGMLGSKEGSDTAMLYINIENLSHRRASYYVKQEFDGNFFFWTINHLLYDPETKMRFGYKEFLQKTDESIIRLYNDIANNKPTAYDGIIKSEDIKKIHDQIKVSKYFSSLIIYALQKLMKRSSLLTAPQKKMANMNGIMTFRID